MVATQHAWEELRDWVLWLQHDAAYLTREAMRYRDCGECWLAAMVQRNAAHSARLARQGLGDMDQMVANPDRSAKNV